MYSEGCVYCQFWLTYVLFFLYLHVVWEKIRETKDKDRWQASNEVSRSCLMALLSSTNRCMLLYLTVVNQSSGFGSDFAEENENVMLIVIAPMCLGLLSYLGT